MSSLLDMIHPLQQLHFSHLHFLRPAWLLMPLVIIPLALALYRKASSGANWRRAIAPELIDHLLEPGQTQRRRWVWLLGAAWLLAALAMAGPTWEKVPQPVLQKRDGLVIVLDLSLSMYAEDIQPSRLQRARYKIFDILKRRREGLTGLVVYSADAHVVAPLTDDTATIANLVPALAPAMMPSFGSNAAAGIESAIQLLQNSGFERGRILLISDAIDDAESGGIASNITGRKWQLSLMSVGTEQGSPIPTPNGFLKNDKGSIAIAQMHRADFEALARKTGASYSDLRLDDSDIDTLLRVEDLADANSTRTVQREFDQWRERGPQLVMLLLLLAALAFRRGWVLVILLLPLSAPSQAFDVKDQWRNLWQRPDQQAQRLFAEGNSRDAAQKFIDPAWRGAAQYRSGDYENAAQSLESLHSADAHYNRGNALAQAGKLQDAIAAYDAALKANPTMDDAKFNRELVKKQLEQQQRDNKSQPQQDNKSAQQKKENQQQDSSSSQQQSGENKKSNDSQANGEKNSSENKDTSASQQQSDRGQKNKSAAEEKSGNSAKAESQHDKPDEKPAPSADQAQPTQNDENQNLKNGVATTTEDGKPSEQQLQQRATEQWLRQIPDDPAGLLRRKFLYEYQQRQRSAPARGDQPTW